MTTKSMIYGILVAMVPASAMAAAVAAPPADIPLPRAQDPVTNSLGAVDTARSIVLSGTVKFIKLGPVRSRVQVLVANGQGEPQEWSLEGPTQQVMGVRGAKRRPIAQWDNVTFAVHPLKGELRMGEIRQLTVANGIDVPAPGARKPVR